MTDGGFLVFVGGSSTITIPFYLDVVCNGEEGENLKMVWKDKVEQVFESHKLSVQVDWEEGKMRVKDTEDTESREIVCRGGRALTVLSAGLSTQYVEPILSGTIHCEVIYIRRPDDIMESDFECKYEDFMNTFLDEIKCDEKLSCQVVFLETAVLALSKSKDATWLVKHFVKVCLLGNTILDEAYFEHCYSRVFASSTSSGEEGED